MRDPSEPPPAVTPEHLDEWVQSFRGPLVGLIASWGPGWRDAEEMAADAFAEAWLSRDRFAGDPDDLGAVGAWLRGIAMNLARTARRKKRSHQAVSEDLAMPPVPETDDRQDRLREAFAGLRTEHQNILRMYYLEETGTVEVAALLGLTRKAVENRLYQARKALRAKVGPREITEVTS